MRSHKDLLAAVFPGVLNDLLRRLAHEDVTLILETGGVQFRACRLQCSEALLAMVLFECFTTDDGRDAAPVRNRVLHVQQMDLRVRAMPGRLFNQMVDGAARCFRAIDGDENLHGFTPRVSNAIKSAYVFGCSPARSTGGLCDTAVRDASHFPVAMTKIAPMAGATQCSQCMFAFTQSLMIGSVAAISPATHPSKPAPIVMMMGKRSMSFSRMVEPKTTSGMEMARPRISSRRLSFAAAAT